MAWIRTKGIQPSDLPTGGTQGQFLVKQSAADLDADWETVSLTPVMFDTMPDASDHPNETVIYTGITNETYSQGRMYKSVYSHSVTQCSDDSTSTKAYLPAFFKGTTPQVGDIVYSDKELTTPIYNSYYSRPAQVVWLNDINFGDRFSSGFEVYWTFDPALNTWDIYEWEELPSPYPGHEIKDSSGNIIANESSLQFIDFDVADNTTTETTEVKPHEMTNSEWIEVFSTLPGTPTKYHKYSTTEQVVGEWIDGKPVYEIISDAPITPSSDNLITGTSFASSEYSNGNRNYAFDDNPTSNWAPAQTTSPSYIGYNNADAFVFDYATATIQDAGDNSEDWYIEGSNDGSTWTRISNIVTHVSNAPSGTTYTFNSIDTTNSYTNIRLYTTSGIVPSLATGRYTTIGTLRFYKKINGGYDTIIKNDKIADNSCYILQYTKTTDTANS